MSLGQRPSAELRVVAHGGRREELGERLDLHVPELAHVEMMAEHPHRPAQEEVTACLHDALADYHPLPLIGVACGARVGLEHGMASLLHLQEQWIVGAGREEGD